MIKRNYSRKTERGQAFVELAISLVFLLVLFTVMVDLGWAFYTMIAMRDTVQEAAVYGSMCPIDENLIKKRLVKSASAPLDINQIDTTDLTGSSDPSGMKIDFVDSAGNTGAAKIRGNSIRVTLKYEHQIVVPFAGAFIGKTAYPLEVTVADTILKENNKDCN